MKKKERKGNGETDGQKSFFLSCKLIERIWDGSIIISMHILCLRRRRHRGSVYGTERDQAAAVAASRFRYVPS